MCLPLTTPKFLSFVDPNYSFRNIILGIWSSIIATFFFFWNYVRGDIPCDLDVDLLFLKNFPSKSILFFFLQKHETRLWLALECPKKRFNTFFFLQYSLLSCAANSFLRLCAVQDAPRFLTVSNISGQGFSRMCDRRKLHLSGAAFQNKRGGQEKLDSQRAEACNHSTMHQLSCDNWPCART